MNLSEKYANFKNHRIEISKVPADIEQEIIRTFFFNKQNGIFVDVGANHPFDYSQSYHLEEMGWRGLLIEPLPSYCELLRLNRKATVIQNACSSEANHKKTLPLSVAGALSTLEENLVAIGAKKSNDVVYVETRTLNSILSDNHIDPGFDFLSIDIEGHEMEMFKGFDMRKWKPKLILLEDHVTSHLKHNYMLSHGYQLLLRTGINSLYVPEDEKYTFSTQARLEFFRKYWLGLLGRKIRYRVRS